MSDDLRKLAEAATPVGPWTRHVGWFGGGYDYIAVGEHPADDDYQDVCQISSTRPGLADYIAAASPDVILALLDALEFVNRTLDPSHPAAEHVQRALERP